ncbi:MAG: hypothetical protein JWM57_2908 [Phycisphaerales bacterium]|nr:hypothetical protein [Phycisphaerales bacterium]
MTDPAAPPALSYNTVPAAYGGVRDMRGTLWLIGWCIALAAGGTLPLGVALFIDSPLITLGSVALQCLVIGAGLMMLFERFPIRRRIGAYAIAFLTAVAALLFTHLVIYGHDLFGLAMTVHNDAIGASVLDMVNGRALRLHALFIPRVWFGGGLVNNVIWRFQHLHYFAVAAVIHFLLVIIAAFFGLKVGKPHSWCGRCGALVEPKNLLVLPTWASGELAQTVKNEDLKQAIELSRVGATAELGSSCVVARQLRCGICQYNVIDVVVRAFAAGGPDVYLAGPLEPSDELVDALRSTPVIAASSTPADTAAD